MQCSGVAWSDGAALIALRTSTKAVAHERHAFLAGNLTSLMTLSVAQNQLTGTIPSSIGTLAALATLDLSENMLSGESRVCQSSVAHWARAPRRPACFPLHLMSCPE